MLDTPSSKAPQADFTFRRAIAGYDAEFRGALTRELITTIATASRLADADVIAIRSTETVDALTDIVITMLALVPVLDDPAELDRVVAAIAARIRKQVAQARAEGAGDRLGARKGGRA